MGLKFERGDFLRKNNKKGSFMIYEGNNLSDSAYKKMTLVCYYDPEKYVMGSVGYETKPKLEIATKLKPCVDTIDTEEEDFWVKKCTEKEKNDAMEILRQHGLFWCEDTMELIDMESGEVIRRIVIPNNKYYGQIIHPISEKFKKLIKKYCTDKLKAQNYYSPHYNYDYYDD